MIINIISSDKLPYRKVLNKSNSYNGNTKLNRKKTFFASKEGDYTILLNKHGVSINFEPENIKSIEILKDYIAYVFNGTSIGVDKENLLTSNLPNIKVFTI